MSGLTFRTGTFRGFRYSIVRARGQQVGLIQETPEGVWESHFWHPWAERPVWPRFGKKPDDWEDLIIGVFEDKRQAESVIEEKWKDHIMDNLKQTSTKHAKALQKALKHLKGLIVLYSAHGPRTWPDTAEPEDLKKFADACLDLAEWKAVVRVDEEIAARLYRREQLEARKKWLNNDPR